MSLYDGVVYEGPRCEYEADRMAQARRLIRKWGGSSTNVVGLLLSNFIMINPFRSQNVVKLHTF